MPKVPRPPASLASVKPEIKVLSRGTFLSRVYFQGGPHPTTWSQFRHFGPTASRFDHHEDPPRTQESGILYAATDAATTFAEVFQETRTINRSRRAPWLVVFRLRRSVTLLDLTTRWITQVGASMAIHSAPRSRARPWSRLFYRSYTKIEGLYCSSSMYGNEPMVALYERAKSALPREPETNRALADRHLAPYIAEIGIRLGYTVWPPA